MIRAPFYRESFSLQQKRTLQNRFSKRGKTSTSKKTPKNSRPHVLFILYLFINIFGMTLRNLILLFRIWTFYFFSPLLPLTPSLYTRTNSQPKQKRKNIASPLAINVLCSTVSKEIHTDPIILTEIQMKHLKVWLSVK